MNRPSLPLLPLHQIPPGQTAQTFALLCEHSLHQTREGKLYYACRFKDRFRTVALMVWAESPWFTDCESKWKLGQVYRLALIFNIHGRYGPQIELLNWREVQADDRLEGFELVDLVESSRLSPQKMWEELQDLVAREISNESVRGLILTIYSKYQRQLYDLPATAGKFYPFRGGWLEHTLSLAKCCILLVDHYRQHYDGTQPPLDRDLVLAGALLHDIGRVLEYKADSLGFITEMTVPGRLFGHILLGKDLVHRTATELGNIPGDFLERLEHLIVSHLILPEWGSPRLPNIPEALILHHADDLDAKLEMYLRCLNRDQNPGPFTTRDPLLGKPLLKPGVWPDERVS